MDNKKKEEIGLGIGGIIFEDEKGKVVKMPFEVPLFEEMPKEVYANMAIVNHSKHEFNIYFSRVETPVTRNQIPKKDNYTLPIVAKIVVPPSLIENLIKALEKNYKTFLEDLNKPEEPEGSFESNK
jgi:hypothetical protein